jgi:predicted acetyltransferase
VSVEVRTCVREEVSRALAPISHFFGRTPVEERTERFLRVLEPERMHAAFDGDAIVGGAGALSFELTVPGARLPAAGVTVVGVLPTHRRRGILTTLMRAQLDDIHRRGEPLACLWASEETIYGRFGYGMAALTGDVDLLRRHGVFREQAPRGDARLLSAEEALELLPPIYEQVAARTPGMFARSPAWWEARTLGPDAFPWAGEGEQLRVLLELDGLPVAYALYRVAPSFEGGNSTGVVQVLEALGVTGAAESAIWRYLLDVDWLERVKAWLLPIDHPLLFLLAEPRRLRFRIGDGLWIRLVDVATALSGRGYAGEGRVVLDVRDGFCQWNEGRYTLEAGQARRSDEEPQIRLDVADLASVYLGAFSFAQLARARRLEELSEGAARVADALFRTDRAPWCPEIF